MTNNVNPENLQQAIKEFHVETIKYLQNMERLVKALEKNNGNFLGSEQMYKPDLVCLCKALGIDQWISL